MRTSVNMSNKYSVLYSPKRISNENKYSDWASLWTIILMTFSGTILSTCRRSWIIFTMNVTISRMGCVTPRQWWSLGRSPRRWRMWLYLKIWKRGFLIQTVAIRTRNTTYFTSTPKWWSTPPKMRWNVERSRLRSRQRLGS